jgi:hypothetical protein
MSPIQSRIEDQRKIVPIEQETLYVAFNGHQVAVTSNVPEIIELVEHGFSEMLEPEPARIVGRLEVFREGEKYHIAGNNMDSEAYRSKSLKDILKWFSQEVIHYMTLANPDLLWLHAGAAAYRDNAMIFPGVWGSGKSTLVTSLCEDGWDYLSDDIVPIEMSSGRVLPFHRTPTIRKNSGQEMPSHRLGELQKIEIKLNRERICRKPVKVIAILFPIYDHGASARLAPQSPANAALELLACCMNYEKHGEVAVRYVCGLMEHLPASRLYYGNGKSAAELIGSIYKE